MTRLAAEMVAGPTLGLVLSHSDTQMASVTLNCTSMGEFARIHYDTCRLRYEGRSSIDAYGGDTVRRSCRLPRVINTCHPEGGRVIVLESNIPNLPASAKCPQEE